MRTSSPVPSARLKTCWSGGGGRNRAAPERCRKGANGATPPPPQWLISLPSRERGSIHHAADPFMRILKEKRNRCRAASAISRAFGEKTRDIPRAVDAFRG